MDSNNNNNINNNSEAIPRRSENLYKIKLYNVDVAALQEAITQVSIEVAVAQASMEAAVKQAVHVQSAQAALLSALQTASVKATGAVSQSTIVKNALQVALKGGQPENEQKIADDA